jgi:putative transposase
MVEGQRMTTAAEVVARVMAGEHGDFVRDAVALIAQESMEAEITDQMGVAHREVSDARATHCKGYRPRGVGDPGWGIELLIPRKRRRPAYFPSFLEPRRRAEQAIVTVVVEAYVNGVSTAKLDRRSSSTRHRRDDQRPGLGVATGVG